MYSLFISPEITFSLFLHLLLFVLLSIALYHTLILLHSYKREATSALQYSLEKRAYLIATIIQLSLFAYIFLLFFFIHTLEGLASLLPGAMCAAGVVEANIYGLPLILLHFCIIILSLLWISLHQEDLRNKKSPYFKRKFQLFLALYMLIATALITELLFFTQLDFSTPVLCCSTLYRQSSTLPFSLTPLQVALLFYSIYFLLIFSLYKRKRVPTLLLILLFLPLSYYATTYFFSPYIYELPTHRCPFCLLHKEYYFIGYFLYGTYILALYYTLKSCFVKKDKNTSYKSIFFLTLFVFILSFNFIKFIVI